jgi:D-alanyl-lipoteichoic acid acyltransferase DltB (MBOAT superfamily)
MLFNSLEFLFFVPLVLLGVLLLPGSQRQRWMLAASCVFYGSWDWRFLLMLLCTTGVDYLLTQRIHATGAAFRRRQYLLVSVVMNLSVLGFFKYFNFFVDSAAAGLEALGLHASVPTLQIILPVGISFYTFQSMSYVIDVYRRDAAPADSLIVYALYILYFPQLVAGPISRVGDLLPQIVNPGRVTAERVNVGLCLILLGLAKKVLIADMLAPEVNRIFADPSSMTTGELLRGAYLFAFQIYGDFAGYSDIARGVSEFFGIRLMINFEQPYLSRSITEFWRRWHISLSSWLRDYLYIPLGGNRYGAGRTYRNLMLTMLIGGLWHGAAWTFVAWGGWHGALLAVERYFGIGKEGAGRVSTSVWRHRALACAATVLTFHLATIGWIFFRAPDFGVAFAYLAGLAAGTDLGAVGALPFLVGAVILVLDVPQDRSGDHAVFLRLPWWVQSPVYAAVCLGLLLYGGREVPFIYFQF